MKVEIKSQEVINIVRQHVENILNKKSLGVTSTQGDSIPDLTVDFGDIK